ncbi:MAG: type II toxin-antitoxin system ParD family antitoxin [Candidatus Korobacteraceae bacterium]|jgi:putative addiction module CopG family antidote
MKISLSPDIERLIAEKLSSGRYQSADEVVREGLELLQKQDTDARRTGTPTMSLDATFEHITNDVPDADWNSVPSDLSKNLDHYLYGARKAS